MPITPSTLPIHLVTSLLEVAGIDRSSRVELLNQAGIPLFLLDKPQGRVTVQQFAGLYRLLVQEKQDEMPGFFSRALRPGALKFLCLGLLDAPNLQVALYRYCQYFRVLMDDLRYDLEIHHQQACLTLSEQLPPRTEAILVHEMLLKLVHGLASWLIGEKIPPLKIDCAYPAPQDGGDPLYFYPGQVNFNQPRTAIYFDRLLLKKPLRQSRRSLASFLKKAPENWIDVSFPDRQLTPRVQEYLLDRGMAASIQEVAADLHLSVRTLSRRLQREGTSFQGVKDEVRRDEAIAWLTRNHQPLTSLAGHLGFEDLPSFNRAFKKWTGSPPGAYRRGLRPKTA
ncbi:AraC family transcriptional regulator [Marinospirillum perlucidum]|uniref:AraC family transcriptional regulator n=1 Tax=Marinospirillum perlucidum TaxID=1982602 RepID=UPI000DF314F3|nr:AraC family transcriptional regulator ligand-binding domain-containing protein [Marinospirillum perlucidum]